MLIIIILIILILIIINFILIIFNELKKYKYIGFFILVYVKS